jgi:hypothetical protein
VRAIPLDYSADVQQIINSWTYIEDRDRLAVDAVLAVRTPVGQIEDSVLVVGQASVDRVPLDPRFKTVGVRSVSNTGKNLRGIVQLRNAEACLPASISRVEVGKSR